MPGETATWEECAEYAGERNGELKQVGTPERRDEDSYLSEGAFRRITLRALKEKWDVPKERLDECWRVVEEIIHDPSANKNLKLRAAELVIGRASKTEIDATKLQLGIQDEEEQQPKYQIKLEGKELLDALARGLRDRKTRDLDPQEYDVRQGGVPTRDEG